MQGVLSYGVSVTTLSEVFLRVGQDQPMNRHESQHVIEDINRNRQERVASLRGVQASPTAPLQAPGDLYLRHIEALLVKRWHSAKRDRKVML